MIGRHLILEHWGGALDRPTVEPAMVAAAQAAGAQILSAQFHPFSGGGLTGVLLLAESHITIHTWPEHGYAALDLFMCGDAPVERAADMLDARLKPRRTTRQVISRGLATYRNQASHPA